MNKGRSGTLRNEKEVKLTLIEKNARWKSRGCPRECLQDRGSRTEVVVCGRIRREKRHEKTKEGVEEGGNGVKGERGSK